ncbi:Tpr protein C [Treponema pallidum subsp. pallidum]|uniref:major outer sheath N-terminal domain-containing protein n=1 Tax=Treponema pallidum TaxID=160 RepID=UPI0010CA5ACE|nr:major outer sheath N-terminal domain-containing protein [Treponema pallidum]QCP96409.1 Tpr protein C [Treponema pallidum subsp. pallidum]
MGRQVMQAGVLAGMVCAASGYAGVLTPQVSGTAQLQWGIAFQKNPRTGPGKHTHGFRTTNSLTISLPLVSKHTHTRRGEARSGVWAQLQLKDLAVELASSKSSTALSFTKPTASFQATLHCYGAYLTVGTSPSCVVNFAQLWKPFVTRAYSEKDTRYAPGFSGSGAKLGYQAHNVGNSGVDVDIGFLSFLSNGAWDSTDTTHSKYGFGADATLSYGVDRQRLLTLELAGNATLDQNYVKGTEDSKNENKTALLWGVGGRLTLEPGAGFRFSFALDAGNQHQSNAHAQTQERAILKAREVFRRVEGKLVQNLPNIMMPPGITEQTTLIEMVGLAALIAEGTLGSAIQTVLAAGALAALVSQLVPNIEQGVRDVFRSSDPRVVTAKLLAFLERAPMNALNIDALLRMQWKWLSSGIYFATAGTNIFGKRVFATTRAHYFDFAGFLKLETKSGDPYTHLLTGLNAGVEARVYIPLTYIRYRNNGGYELNRVVPSGIINMPILGKAWCSYRIPLGSHAWLAPHTSVLGTTNRFNIINAAGNLLNERALQYQVGLTFSPFEKVELSAQWEQGVLSDVPYMGIAESIWSERHFGTLVCGMKVTW